MKFGSKGVLVAKAEYKVCPKCGEKKPLSEFETQRSAPDGKTKKCKICRALPPDEINIDEFVRLTHEKSNGELGEQYSHSVYTINQWKVALRKLGYDCGTIKTWGGRTFHKKVTVNDIEPEFPEMESAGFPESQNEDYTNYDVLDRDRSIVLGDCHIPDHDSKMLDMAYRVAERYNVKTLILNGDFVKLDTFSTWRKTHATPEDFVQDDLMPATEILRLFMKQFDETFWHKGNHEDRLARWVHGHFDISWFFTNLLGVKYSAYPFTVQQSAGEKILICHPRNHRLNPLSLPLKYAGKYLMHVICGHLHRLAFGWHESAQFWGCEGGHGLDAKKTYYKQTTIDTFPLWTPGFVMVIDAWPHLVEPRNYEFYMQPHHDIEQERKQGPSPEELAEIEKHKTAIAEFEAQYMT